MRPFATRLCSRGGARRGAPPAPPPPPARCLALARGGGPREGRSDGLFATSPLPPATRRHAPSPRPLLTPAARIAAAVPTAAAAAFAATSVAPAACSVARTPCHSTWRGTGGGGGSKAAAADDDGAGDPIPTLGGGDGRCAAYVHPVDHPDPRCDVLIHSSPRPADGRCIGDSRPRGPMSGQYCASRRSPSTCTYSGPAGTATTSSRPRCTRSAICSASRTLTSMSMRARWRPCPRARRVISPHLHLISTGSPPLICPGGDLTHGP